MKNLLLSITLLLALSATAQPWTRINPLPQEHGINDIFKIPGTNTLVSVAEGSTIMKSDDQGQSWELSFNPAGQPDYSVNGCVYYIDQNVGFIGASEKSILKTTNGGASWTTKFTTENHLTWDFINDIVRLNDSKMFAVGNGGFLITSEDLGETWYEVETGTNMDLLEIVRVDDLTAFIISNSIFDNRAVQWLKTSDGGQTWTVETPDLLLPGIAVSDMFFIDENTAVLFVRHDEWYASFYRSTDGGVSWELIDQTWGPADCRFHFMDENNGIAVCNTWMYESYVYVTDNGGNNWTQLDDPDLWLDNDIITSLEYDLGIYFATTTRGSIYQSADTAQNWSLLSSRRISGDIYDAEFIDAERGFICSEGTFEDILWKTIDGGTTWENFHTLGEKGCLWFADSLLGYVVSYDSVVRLSKTINGGTTWQFENLSTDFDFIPSDVEFFDINKGMIAGDYTVIKTTNGGISWQEVEPLTQYRCIDIKYLSETEIIIVGSNGDNTMVFHSDDSGLTWDTDNLGPYGVARDLCIVDENSAFIATNRGYILHSTDGMLTWTPTQVNADEELSIKAVTLASESVGFAVATGSYNDNLLKSTDGGLTWNTIDSYSTSSLNALYFSDEMNGLIFGDHGLVMKTSTGGVVNTPNYALSNASNPFHIYPNPVDNEFRIEFNGQNPVFPIQIRISDLSGRVVKVKEFKSEDNLSINCRKLTTGVYTVTMIDAQGKMMTVKMVKMD